MKKALVLFFLIFTCLLCFSSANAQFLSGDISIEATPKNPRLNQEVKVRLSSHAIDLNQAKITWAVNGSVSSSGVGKKDFLFSVTNQSAQIIVGATIETINGSVVDKYININPNSVDLVWEAYNAYVPPFYKGKALVASEGFIKTVALPNGNQILGYSYKWKQDNANKTNSSGYGKNFYVFRNTYLDRGNTVEVSVADLFGNSVGQGKLSLQTGNPILLFYKKDPNLGTLWEKTLSNNYTIDKQGETIVAEPYFFSSQDSNFRDLSFEWSLNGETVDTPNPKNILSVKPDTNSGNASITLVVNNIKTMFQKANNEINVNF